MNEIYVNENGWKRKISTYLNSSFDIDYDDDKHYEGNAGNTTIQASEPKDTFY